MNEIWKDIAGYEGRYQVSDQGRVRGRRSLLAFSTHPKGYRSVCLRRPEKTTRLLHRLVALAFVANPNKLPQVNHIDGIKTNNAASNLEWVTNKQNHVHAALLDLKAYGVENGNAKLNNRTARSIRKLACTGGQTLTAIGDAFGISRHTVRSIRDGDTWHRA